MNADYIKVFFTRKGKVDLSNSDLTPSKLRNLEYNRDTRVLYLTGNYITSLRDTNLPRNLLYLNIDNNPLRGGYFLKNETPNLLFLSIRNCDLDKVDFEYLPSLINIDLRDNKNLTSLYSLGKMKILRRLDIRNTGIVTLDWSKFVSIDPTKKLKLYCDSGVEFVGIQPSWIIVKN